MNRPLHILIAESETPGERRERRASVGRSEGETMAGTLGWLRPGTVFDHVKPADADAALPGGGAIAAYDAVVLTGSPMHLYDDTPEVTRTLAFMVAVFDSGVPSFGSCAGLQIAAVAAGGTVRTVAGRHEAGFARRIAPSKAGRGHPLLAGRPAAWDAPAIHGDEVERLPDDATLLAGNAVSAVQAAEIRHGAGVFWGVQYHPELSLREVAAALRRQGDDLIAHGLARSEEEIEAQAALADGLHAEPWRPDLAWRLGVDAQVTDRERRSVELRNFLDRLVDPTRSARGRG